MTSFRGHFGLDPDHLVPGTLNLLEDGSFLLEIERFIFVPEQLDISNPGYVTQTFGPRELVADYMPRNILGMLENLERVTLLGALMENLDLIGPSQGQSFRGALSLFGAHLADEQDPVLGLRWSWRIPRAMVPWAEENPASVGGAVTGTLTAWERGPDAGLQFVPHHPVSLRLLRNKVSAYCSQLLALWCARKVPGITKTEVFVGDSWCVLNVQSGDSQSITRSALLPPRDLSLAIVAAWVPLAADINPFHFIVNALTQTLQLDAQVLTTVLEGLHRRICDEEPRFRGLTEEEVKEAARSARIAGVQALLDRGYGDTSNANQIFSETLRHLNDMTYQHRIIRLVEPVYRLVPSLFGPELLDWAKMVKKIRNFQSHQLEVEFDEPDIALYYVTVESCKWALILRILIELVPEYDYKRSLARSDVFRFALANIDREAVWGSFSTLQRFQDEVQGESTA